MFARALIAFFVLPGIAAGVVPFIIFKLDPWKMNGWMPAVFVVVLGIIILFWCIRDFFVAGKGTLAPWDPPKELVIIGLYKYVRNPMYIGVLFIAGGWGLLLGSLALDVYTALLASAFHVRVVLKEEPSLRRQFGKTWEVYASNVNRWLPKIKPWHAP